MHNISILLIEDAADIAELIEFGLQDYGMGVEIASTGHQALEYLSMPNNPDLILLDLILPDMDGLHLLPKIKKSTAAPIIIVSAKNTLKDKINGIEAGADDYISKPFHMEELAVRIKAQLRRNLNDHVPPNTNLRIGGWLLDRDQLQAFDSGGDSANLTPNEYILLETLISKPNKVFTREQLIDSCRDSSADVSDRAIDTQLSRIRSKLKICKDDMHVFQAIRGIGYKYSECKKS